MPRVAKLSKGTGFAYSLVPAREDRLARRACEYAFGYERVSKVLDVLHRSEISYERLLEDFMGYDNPDPPANRDNVYMMCLQSVRQELKSDKLLIPYTTGAVTRLPDFPNSKSPGLPWKNLGYKTKREVIEDQENIHKINVMWQHISVNKHVELADVCLFARAQVAKTDTNKIRATWGYPLEVYMEEARFFYPVQDFIKSHNHKFHIAYGLEMANGGMTQVNDMCRRHNGKVMVVDWKSFDKTIPSWLIRDAFAILAELVDFAHVLDSDGLVWEVAPHKSRRRWKKMIDYFVETPIRTCKGERFLVTGGVPSGSCWTNIIDSIISCIVLRYVTYQTLGHFPNEEIFLGDDAVVCLRGNVNLDDMACVALKQFGMILNVSKSYVTTNIDNVHFLGYFNQAGVPFKNLDFLIASFIRPEHTRYQAVEAAASALGQMWTTFDPYYATLWYEVIVHCCKAYSIELDDVVLHLRNHYFRHKYLAQVGIDAKTITLPGPDEDGMISVVHPRLQCNVTLEPKIWSYETLWQQVLDEDLHRWSQEAPD